MARVTFLSLPVEIRLNIYDHLLTSHGKKTLSIRTEDEAIYDFQKKRSRVRTRYRIMSDRFRARSIETTYGLVSNPGIWSSILGVSTQIHKEASHHLYSFHTFDFDQDIEAVIAFLGDLTPLARSSIKRINIVKRALPYSKEYDRYEWSNVCKFISENMNLTQLGLGIIGGKPSLQWEAKDVYQKADYSLITKFEGMEWVRQLSAIKGLQELDVKAHLSHCPPPVSNAMAFFVNFSASIENGFAEYLKEHMIVGAA